VPQPELPASQLTAATVAGLIADQFPDLAGCEIAWLGAGWDHDLFSVGADWILRFPQRADRVDWLARETKILAIAGETLAPGSVPVFELAGRPSAAFPYPFVGYRRLPGTTAGQPVSSDLDGLAADIGELFSRLHRIEPKQIPPCPGGYENEPWDQLQTELVDDAAAARALLPAHLLAKAEPYLSGQVAPPPADGPRRFIHNDICPEHVIVDATTGRLTGLIDFTDSLVGEVVIDFLGLIGIAGYPFIHQAAAAYRLPLGENFTAKLEWLSRTMTLTWLADSAVNRPDDVPRYLTWVTYAFGGVSGAIGTLADPVI
jgi:aminoglycoside phosphotransferase (APT) family kinase protein